MSKGNPIVTLRLEAEVRVLIEQAIASRNQVTREAPWTLSDWLRQAVADKLAHMRRSRSRKRSKVKEETKGAWEGES